MSLICSLKYTLHGNHLHNFAFGEVRYYFQREVSPGQRRTFALLSRYSDPHSDLLMQSSHTVWACHLLGDAGLTVVDVTDIIACVAMIPRDALPRVPGYTTVPYFVMEKIGDHVATDSTEGVEDVDD